MKTYFFILLSFFIQLNGIAQSDSISDVVELDEVVFSANKTEEKKENLPYTIEIINNRTIALENPQTAADMLSNTGNVMVQKSQAGGGSPILRGFEANRVLIVVDGVRMNNAIYRGGHLQDVITIDNAMLDRAEVIFGPSSVMYGSDAIGGVMHFYTLNPRFSTADSVHVNATSYFRYSSANKEKTGHLHFSVGNKRIASLTSVTFSDFGDVRAGANRSDAYPDFGLCKYYAGRNYAGTADSMFKNTDENVQARTAYSQVSLLEKINFKVNDFVSLGANVQYSTSSDINRYDRLSQYQNDTTLKYADWYYGPQERWMVNLNGTLKNGGNLFDKLYLVTAYQDVSQSRMTRNFASDYLRSQFENVKVFSINADFTKSINEKHRLNYGAELLHNIVNSTATTKNILTGAEISPTETRYPNAGSTMSSAAAYLTHQWKISDKYILSEGIRYTAYALSANFDTAASTSPFQFPFTSIKQSASAINGNLALTVKPTRFFKYSLLGSTGFRAPNVDDIGKVFESAAGALIVPNANLKPEYSYNLESSMELKVFDGRLKFQGGYFYTILDNAIITQNAQYEGKDSILFNGTMSNILTSKNANRAYVQGSWASVFVKIVDGLTLKSTINYTSGKYFDAANDTLLPMDHIPPSFGQTSLNFHKGKFEGVFYLRYSGAKTAKNYALGKEDNEVFSADPINGYMPSWTTLNLKAVYHFNVHVFLDLGVENLLDKHYRVFASGVSSPGRNIYFTLRLKF